MAELISNKKRLYIIGVFDEETETKIRNIRKIYTHEVGKGFLPHITMTAVDVVDVDKYIAETYAKFRELMVFPVTFDVLDYFAPIKAAALFAAKDSELMNAFEYIRKASRACVTEYYTGRDIYIPHTTILWDIFGGRDYKEAAEDMKSRKFTPIIGNVIQLQYSLMNSDGTFTIIRRCDLRRGKEMGVVGWVNWESDYKDCPGVYIGGNEEYRTPVIKKIQESGLKFSGVQHQTIPGCCPLFEDGTVLRASQPVWGAIMSEAWNKGTADDWKWSMPHGEEMRTPDMVTTENSSGIVSFSDAFAKKRWAKNQ